MKRDLLLASITLAVATSACSPSEPAKAAEPAAPPAEADVTTPDATVQTPPDVVVGGYAAADIADPAVKEAHDLAVAEIYKRDPTRALVEKTTAELQVVAGINYRFEIVMGGGATYRIVVYRDLQNTLTVSEYEKVS
jgi:ABC-type Fe3+-hydroxamate transport system substrate-binding protein